MEIKNVRVGFYLEYLMRILYINRDYYIFYICIIKGKN